MPFTMIFAAEPGSHTSDDPGHCWVAVECPKGNWTVRGFYPDAKGFAGGILGSRGVIMDDFGRFKSDRHRMRTRTKTDLTEGQVRGALNYMFEFGASARRSILKRNDAPNRALYGMHHAEVRKPRAVKKAGYFPAPDRPATHGWSMWGEQCAVFAANTCASVGFVPFPLETYCFPWTIHAALGIDGDIDSKSLPAPFAPDSP